MQAVRKKSDEDDLITLAYRAYDVLKAATDLSPRNPALCRALEVLFAATSGSIATGSAHENDALVDGLNEGFIAGLRKMMAQAEQAMEHYWSQRFSSMPQASYADLEQFIYWKNYLGLARKEIALLRENDAALNGKLCFVGQGPLPMTMLIYHHLTQAVCCGVDRDRGAMHDAQGLAKAVGADRCSFVHADGRDHDYAAYDIVCIASLVPVKDAIIRKVMQDRIGRTTHILVRTAEHLSRLYYAPYEGAADGVTYLGKTAYTAETINTTLLYRCD